MTYSPSEAERNEEGLRILARIIVKDLLSSRLPKERKPSTLWHGEVAWNEAGDDLERWTAD